MADSDSSFNVPAPYGMSGYDLGALSLQQQEELWDLKINTRMEDELYLRKHPEVEILLGEFMRSVLLKKPKNIREFAADAAHLTLRHSIFLCSTEVFPQQKAVPLYLGTEYYTDARLPEKIQRKVHEWEKMLKMK